MSDKKIQVHETTAEELISDDKNINLGSLEGKEMIEHSFEKHGAGRSILIDKNNKIIAGNKSLDGFVHSEGKKIVIVETTGDTLIAVKRTDIDIDSKEGREMAIADNQTSKVNYVMDAEVVQMLSGEHEINTTEWGIEFDDDGTQKRIIEEDLRPFTKTHILLSFPPQLLIDIAPHLEAIRKIRGVEVEQASN